LNQQGGSVTLRLTPAELGTVRIELDIKGTTVAARFGAETAQGQDALGRQLSQLRTALEQQGLTVDRLSVQSLPSMQSNMGDLADGADDGRSRGQLDQGTTGGDPETPPDDPNQPEAQPATFDQMIDDQAAEEPIGPPAAA
jgi:flagellar hook-length control protein FliK